ncbi:hypothetical protein PUN28_003485 [Cardiocondyla obscurior]|uniref:Uncharacterized protein n=1 Tax=Cardiocondyla obscurior TaxID=286306 RepID=A0AAW2GL50_9HYME
MRVKHLNFATKPLSLVATFLYFSGKLRSMGYRVLARGILHIYTVADRRGAQRSFLNRDRKLKILVLPNISAGTNVDRKSGKVIGKLL